MKQFGYKLDAMHCSKANISLSSILVAFEDVKSFQSQVVGSR